MRHAYRSLPGRQDRLGLRRQTTRAFLNGYAPTKGVAVKATYLGPGVLLLAITAAPVAYAITNFSPVFKRPLPIAPDACGEGFYTTGPDGTVYGPNYCVRPPFEPTQPQLPRK